MVMKAATKCQSWSTLYPAMHVMAALPLPLLPVRQAVKKKERKVKVKVKVKNPRQRKRAQHYQKKTKIS